MTRSLTTATLAVLVLAACDATEPAAPAAPDVAFSHVGTPGHSGSIFHASLEGGQEVPAVVTDAQGLATFRISPQGDWIEYTVRVQRITDVLMSHIHMQAAGSNGPIVVWLYPAAPPPSLIPGRTDGILAKGTITAGQLVGPLTGGTLEDLLNAIRTGNAYVNVHTTAHPGGEIRGQVGERAAH